MDQSPKGRDIEKLDGDAAAITARGRQITTLGDQMISASDELKKLKDNAVGQKGHAIGKLKDKVGDCYEDLHKAGERYQPTGPVLVTYGKALGHLQPLISSNVSTCEDLWHTYVVKSGAADDATPAPRLPFPAPTDEQKTQWDQQDQAHDAAQAAAKTAHDNFIDEAERFDKNYDTWEDAFDAAADGVGKATHGNISDGFWDDLDGFVAAALEVLKWVGIALFVLTIIIGGPFLAALTLIVGLATLALTAYSFARGNSDGWDLAFAIVGVIPFGKLSMLKNAKGGFFKEVVGIGSKGKPGAFREGFGEFKTLAKTFGEGYRTSGGASRGLRFLSGAGKSFKAWTAPNGFTFADAAARAFTGKNLAHWNRTDLNPVDILGQVAKGQYGVAKKLVTVVQAFA